jgi:hypothetical protein
MGLAGKSIVKWGQYFLKLGFEGTQEEPGPERARTDVNDTIAERRGQKNLRAKIFLKGCA